MDLANWGYAGQGLTYWLPRNYREKMMFSSKKALGVGLSKSGVLEEPVVEMDDFAVILDADSLVGAV